MSLQPGDGSQTEEIGDEKKSIIWPLVKQVHYLPQHSEGNEADYREKFSDVKIVS